jgi:hypothetical protein
MRHAETVRELARTAHGLRGAAARLAVVLGIGPELERDGDGLGAAARDQQGGDGAVDTAAHRDERALRRVREVRLLAGGRAERAVQRVGGELGGVALGVAEPAELGGDLLGSDAGGVEQWRATKQADGGAAGGDRGAATARVEAGVGDRAVAAVGVERERDPDQVAAGGATGGAGAGAVRRVPAPERSFEVLLEAFREGLDTPSVRGARAALEAPAEATWLA